MDALTPIEDRRLALQRELDATKTQKERNRLGQFATPALLASDVLAHARTLLPKAAPVRFLDPAFGTGSFYAALLRHFPRERIKAAVGSEIDPHYGNPARELWRHYPLKIKLGDFTTMKPPAERGRFNLIICNPPYVRHHHLGAAEKSRLRAVTTAACGVRMAGLAGFYCYFLGLAHAWLANDGIAGWLIPSEFMDVNYGGPVKRYLLNQVELLRIHRFDPNDLQFGDALVSSAVVWFRKRRSILGHQVEFSYGGSLAYPAESRLVSAAALQDEPKWTGLATSSVKKESKRLRLADFFSIKRGLATGNNSFFIMPRSEIEARRLPRVFFKPILPGPRYLPSDVIEAEPDGTPKIERQQFILDCRLPESEIKARYPALWAYIETGKEKVASTYLCSRRTPWYAQESRPAPPFVCTYMGRGLAKRAKPFRFILNQSQATAANVYLLLYPKLMLATALEGNPELARLVWKFLDSIPPEILLGEGRVYGGGLYKMEPKELANVPADAIAALLQAVEHRPGIQLEMFQEQVV
jgi:adenine-specific DNA-methyltransferase